MKIMIKDLIAFMVIAYFVIFAFRILDFTAKVESAVYPRESVCSFKKTNLDSLMPSKAIYCWLTEEVE